MKKLENKTAIITGGAGSIGKTTAKMFLEEGAKVLLVDLEEKALKQTVEELSNENVHYCAANVANTEDVKRYLDEAKKYFGAVDIFFNNAGIEGVVKPVTEYPEDEFDKFWTDYKYIEHNIGRWLAYPFIPQLLRGSSVDDIRYLSEKHFENVLRNYYYSSSLKILNTLEESDIRNYIISASADIFVEGAASSLGLAKERFHGIEIEIKNNMMTESLVYPVTWAEGKTEKLKSIVEKTNENHPGKKVIVLAGFGNSYNTDGPFMKYIAEQNFPVGKPISVMINGGEAPDTYKNAFFEVDQSDVYINPKH